jgi:hypothetical protein
MICDINGICDYCGVVHDCTGCPYDVIKPPVRDEDMPE